MSTGAKTGPGTQLGRLHHKKSYQLSSAQSAALMEHKLSYLALINKFFLFKSLHGAGGVFLFTLASILSICTLNAHKSTQKVIMIKCFVACTHQCKMRRLDNFDHGYLKQFS